MYNRLLRWLSVSAKNLISYVYIKYVRSHLALRPYFIAKPCSLAPFTKSKEGWKFLWLTNDLYAVPKIMHPIHIRAPPVRRLVYGLLNLLFITCEKFMLGIVAWWVSSAVISTQSRRNLFIDLRFSKWLEMHETWEYLVYAKNPFPRFLYMEIVQNCNVNFNRMGEMSAKVSTEVMVLIKPPLPPSTVGQQFPQVEQPP